MTLPPISFVVPLAWTGDAWSTPATKWIAANGRATDEEAEAIRFEFKGTRTLRDDLKIEVRLDEINGGIGETVDLELAVHDLREHLDRVILAELWPEGRPPAKDDAERQAQELLINVQADGEQFRKDRTVLNRMTALRDRQRVAAGWPTLIVDPPRGWEDLAEKELPHGYAEAIARAYLRAFEEHAAGK